MTDGIATLGLRSSVDAAYRNPTNPYTDSHLVDTSLSSYQEYIIYVEAGIFEIMELVYHQTEAEGDFNRSHAFGIYSFIAFSFFYGISFVKTNLSS